MRNRNDWCTQDEIRKCRDLILPFILRSSERSLLVWDSTSTHRAKDMEIFLSERRIDPIMIPVEMTLYLLILDLVINLPFKYYLQMKVNDYIEHRMDIKQRESHVKPNFQEILNWVKDSLNKITDSSTASVLRARHLSKTCSFKESYVLSNARDWGL